MKVKEILDKEGVWYRLKHFPLGAKKSEDVERELPDYVDDVVKTIIMKVDDDFKAFCVPKDHLVDYNKVRKSFNARKVRLADADEVLEHSNSPPGGCCPLLVDCLVYMDPTVEEFKTISLGSGSIDHSLEMKTKDLIRIVDPEMMDVSVVK